MYFSTLTLYLTCNSTSSINTSGRYSLSNGVSDLNTATNGQPSQGPFRLSADKTIVDYVGDLGETKTFKFDKV